MALVSGFFLRFLVPSLWLLVTCSDSALDLALSVAATW
jgi:hypothetical protein